MRKLLVALLLFPIALAASPLPDYPFVYVFGSANREVAPDKASIKFNIKIYDTVAERAYHLQGESADTLLAFTVKLQVPQEMVVARPIEKNTVRKEDDKGNDLEIIGYETVRPVQIEINNLAIFPQLIEFLYNQPFIERIEVKFDRKDADSIQQSLTAEACTAAAEKAILLCQGFHKKPKQVKAISGNGFAEMGRPFGFGDDLKSYSLSARNVSGKRDFRVIPATISFSTGVFAIYEIE